MIRITVTLFLVSTAVSTATAAERYAVFKSVDRGRSWIRSDAGMPEQSRINAFGSVGGVLFAGTDSGIFISEDEGRSWRPTTGAAMSSGRIISFATLGQEVFAGTDGSGILASADKGESWVRMAAFPSRKVRCLLAHEKRLYVGTEADGVFVLEGERQIWSALRQGLPSQAQVFSLSAVEGRLFAGLYSKGLYAWDEQEGHWTKAGPLSPLVLAASGGTLIAGHNPGGLYWSANLGASWSKGTAGTIGQLPSLLANDAGELSSEAPVWELASNDEMVLAGASEGIYYSEDHGRTWVRARTGLPSESPGVSFLLNQAFILAGTHIKGANSEPD